MAESSGTDSGRIPLLHRAGAAAADVGSIGEGRPKLRAAIQYGLIALVFGFLALFLITQWNKLPSYDWRFRPAWLVPAVALVFAFYWLQPTLWRVILPGLLPAVLTAFSFNDNSYSKSWTPPSNEQASNRSSLISRAMITPRTCWPGSA